MDSCGFPLATSSVEGRAAGAQFRVNASQAKAWVAAEGAVTAACSRPECLPRHVCYLAREGIPPAMRGALWPCLSGGTYLERSAPAGTYARTVAASAAALEESVGSLLADWNVLPQHPVLGTPRGAAAVRRVCLALCATRPAMLHPPAALAAVAGFVLAVVGLEREEAAFWTLLGLVRFRLPPQFFDDDMAGAGVEERVMNELLAAQCPDVWDAVAGDGDGGAPSAGWVSTLFVRALAPDVAARVFDALVAEGVKALHRVALALCALHSTATLTCACPRGARAVLEWRARHSYDADALLRAAHRSWPAVGLRRSDLERRRVAARAGARDAERGAAARLARLLARGKGGSPEDADSPLNAALMADDRSHDERSATTDSCALEAPSASLDSVGWEETAPPAPARRKTQAAALRLLLSRPTLVARAVLRSTVA